MKTSSTNALRAALGRQNRSIAGWLREAENTSNTSRATWESYLYGRRSPGPTRLSMLVAEIDAAKRIDIPPGARGRRFRRWLAARLKASGLSTTAFARRLRCNITHLNALLDGTSMPRTPERHAELVELAQQETEP